MQKDKILHFLACAALTFLTMGLFFVVNSPYYYAALAGILVSTAAAWGKEYGDKVNPNNKWDWYDVFADSIGTIIGLIVGSMLWLI